MNTNQLYYFRRNGVDHGPHTLEDLRAMELMGDDSVRAEGSQMWISYSELLQRTSSAMQTQAHSGTNAKTDKSLWEYFVSVFRDNYTNFSGRARRKEFWSFMLFYFLISMAVGILTIPMIGDSKINVIGTIVGLVFLLPGIAVSVRRLHDLGKDGLWLLLGFLPVIGAIVLIIWYCTPGVAGPNQYGDDPKANLG